MKQTPSIGARGSSLTRMIASMPQRHSGKMCERCHPGLWKVPITTMRPLGFHCLGATALRSWASSNVMPYMMANVIYTRWEDMWLCLRMPALASRLVRQAQKDPTEPSSWTNAHCARACL
jgi:hypothetical protein